MDDGVKEGRWKNKREITHRFTFPRSENSVVCSLGLIFHQKHRQKHSPAKIITILNRFLRWTSSVIVQPVPGESFH